jgi:CRP/FNR family transcriptional regulator
MEAIMQPEESKRGAFTANAMSELFDSMPTKKLGKSELLIYQGDKIRHFFYIKSGYVKAYTITDAGDERTLLILAPGDVFPLLKDPVGGGHVSLYFYETVAESIIKSIPQDDLLAKIRHDRRAAWEMFRYISDLNGSLSDRIVLLENKSAEDKVSQLLDYLISVCGKQLENDKYILRLKFTHQDIANLIAHTRETASLTVKHLEDQGVIAYHKGHIVVNDRKKLLKS